MIIFVATSCCEYCSYMVATRGADLAVCLAYATIKHEVRQACPGSQMRLVYFMREEVVYHGSAHEKCPECLTDDKLRLVESGDMLVYQCACKNTFLACRLCNSAVLHENSSFVFRCSSTICGNVVDYSKGVQR
jgi:hypothetical protein